MQHEVGTTPLIFGQSESEAQDSQLRPKPAATQVWPGQHSLSDEQAPKGSDNLQFRTGGPQVPLLQTSPLPPQSASEQQARQALTFTQHFVPPLHGGLQPPPPVLQVKLWRSQVDEGQWLSWQQSWHWPSFGQQ